MPLYQQGASTLMANNGRIGNRARIRITDGKNAIVYTEDDVLIVEATEDRYNKITHVDIKVKKIKSVDQQSPPDYTTQKYDHIRCRSCGVDWPSHATDPQSKDCKNKKPAEVPALSESDKRSIEVNMK